MCGIVAYIGTRAVVEILLGGLRRLEYRGYDSAGVAVLTNGGGGGESKAGEGSDWGIDVVKKKGKVSNLAEACASAKLSSTVGIAHTRWATHGAPNNKNAHPHLSASCSVAVVHNGIVENYAALKDMLKAKGYEFRSDTDTEVLAMLVEDIRKGEPGMELVDVVRTALRMVHGTYGCVFLFADQPDLMIGARSGSPLILGVMDGEYLIASDASAVIEHTKDVVYLEEGQVVACTRKGYDIHNVYVIDEEGEKKTTVPPIIHLEMSLDEIEKGGYDHFMLKEIMEQPTVIENCMRGRVDPDTNKVQLGGLREVMPQLLAAKRMIICACGTSYHSALVGEYLLETIARLPVEVEYASEFRYRDPILYPDTDVVVVISQSGETADTLAAVRQAKSNGVLALGLVNVVGSTIARETDAGVYLHVGPEIGVASTKAFTGQVTVLAMMALMLGAAKGTLSEEQMATHVKAISEIPRQIRQVLDLRAKVHDLSRGFRFAKSFLYLGRGFNFPVALEGALKLKEISYIHAEGYAAAEMKHGPIALIDNQMPVVIVAPTKDATYEKIKSNIQEVIARGGCVIAITEEGNEELDDMCEMVMHIPKTEEALTPLLTVIPLQLLSYYVAVLRKCSVDQPRNLAKSVTVE